MSTIRIGNPAKYYCILEASGFGVYRKTILDTMEFSYVIARIPSITARDELPAGVVEYKTEVEARDALNRWAERPQAPKAAPKPIDIRTVRKNSNRRHEPKHVAEQEEMEL